MERFAQLGKSCAPFARGDWNAALVTVYISDINESCEVLLSKVVLLLITCFGGISTFHRALLEFGVLVSGCCAILCFAWSRMILLLLYHTYTSLPISYSIFNSI